MTAARTFWHLPEDEREFLDAFEKFGPVLAVPWCEPRDCAARSLFVPLPLKRLMETQNPLKLLILPVGCLSGLVIRSGALPDGREWFLASPEESPVLAYERGLLQPGTQRLAASHLFGWWSEGRPREEAFREKPLEYIVWAKHMFRWVRRNTPGRVSKLALREKMRGLELIGF